MAYCVNCGVELNPNAAVCPLCGTPAWQPEKHPSAAPYFPTKPPAVGPVSKRELALLGTCSLGSVALICGLLNLVLFPGRRWSLYVIGAAVMLWIWLVGAPLLLRKLPAFFKLTLDVAAVGIYVYLISIDLDGRSWFLGLALPILGVACAVVFLLSFLLRGRRHSRLGTLCLCVGAVGVFTIGVEFAVDRYLRNGWQPGWSLIALAVCLALLIPLLVVRLVPSLRAEVRRRFSL